jgi:Caspase domain
MSKLHALLIGINCYLPNLLPNGLYYKSLHGCVGDALLVDDFLRTRVGLSPENILKLTSTDNGKGKPVEPRSHWPTYENIVNAFRTLTKTAQPGDQVFIHYSGHGGRARTTKPFRKLKGTDGLDEVLVPMDLGNSEGRYLRDTELHFLLRAMVDRGLIVTLVLDSCHAGGGTRSAVPLVKPNSDKSGTRGINEVDLTEREHVSLVAEDDELIREWQRRSGNTRQATVGSSWLLEPQGYVLLAACRSNEEANEYPFDGKQTHGALTYWMIESLAQIGPDFNYKLLHDSVLARVHSQFSNQTPQLEGEANRVVFGAGDMPSYYGITVIQVKDDGSLILNAGRAHGLQPGARLNVFAVDDRQPGAGERRIATVEVTTAGDVETHAKIIDQRPGKALQPGCQAILADVGSIRLRRRIGLTTGAPSGATAKAMQMVARAVAKREDGFLTTSTNGDVPDYVLTINTDGEYIICDAAGFEIPNIRPPLKVESASAEAVVQRLVHLARYANVRELGNTSTQSQLTQKVTVDLVGKAPKYVEGEKPALQSFKRASAVKDGEWIFLRIRNNYSTAVNITILDLQPNWEISQAYPARGGAFESLDPGAELVLPVEMTLPPGCEKGTDILKIFVTVDPTSFRWLELPALDQPEFVDNVRGVPSNDLEKLLAAFSPVGAQSRKATIAASATTLWAAHQLEIEVHA